MFPPYDRRTGEFEHKFANLSHCLDWLQLRDTLKIPCCVEIPTPRTNEQVCKQEMLSVLMEILCDVTSAERNFIAP